MANIDGLEKQLDEVFVKKAPFQLPEDIKKWIVTYLPYINLFIGVLSLVAAYNVYHWATAVSRIVDYANEFARAYGVDSYAGDSRLTLMVWLSIGLLVAQGALWVGSFSAVKAKKKSGWNLLFYALIIGAVYGFVSLFGDYNAAGNFVSYIVGTVVGLYFLFQIRSHYLPAAATKAEPKKAETK